MDDKIRLREYPYAKPKEKRSDDAEAHHTLSSIVIFFSSSNLTIPTLFKSEFISDIIIIPSPPFLSSPLYPPIPSFFITLFFSPLSSTPSYLLSFSIPSGRCYKPCCEPA